MESVDYEVDSGELRIDETPGTGAGVKHRSGVSIPFVLGK